jgi:serine/threonine protein kinase
MAMTEHIHPPLLDEQDCDVTGTVSGQSGDTEPVGTSERMIPDAPDGVPHAAIPELGNRVGNVLLQEKLGQGVSCFVFRGWDEAEQLPVAVKIINWNNVFDKDAALKQMRTEAAALARVKHSRVVRFIDFGFDPRFPYIITEFIEGRPLGDLIRTGGALPPEWACYLTSQIADGLGAVWQAGLVHRDVKPDNVLIGPNGIAKIIDFGLAKAQVLQDAAGQTGPELAGTAAYLAPEQAKDASVVDLRADIYSLGVTFFETLTGQLPFDGKNRIQMIYHHLNSVPPAPASINPAIPGIVNDLCLWMLNKNPAERPQNFDDLRQAFDAIMGM